MTVDSRRPYRLICATSLVHGLTLGALLSAAACSSSNHSVSNSPPPPVTPSTYTVGGTVSGLAADGLVLVNGSTTLPVAAGATSFSFPAVASGTAYAVSVQASPTGVMCSVAMGSGTVQTANVSNVVVTCSTTSYTVGGSVTGLNGAGLVLQNGSDTVSVPANATSFTLPAVASSSSYTVSVKTQPAGLSCAVANGSGTMASANVTNVNVTCTDQPFTVGGTVSGLIGGGLVLANGADTKSVAANATSFTMPTGVDFSTDYAITVQTQPAGLTCSVSNGAGTMGAANVTSVMVTCSAQSFHLGGTITGLTAAGLVLANGSDTKTVDVNASSFTLPTSVAFGSPYAVSVHAQPTGLTCSVTSASGTMPANDVTSVMVTCATASYTLGGTLSGLHGSGLVLQNGTEQLNVASNATSFTFVNGVAYGATYAVTIHAQPHGFNCTLSNDTGTMAGNVTSVAVACTQNAVWAYSADHDNGAIVLYAVNNATHALGATPVASYAYGSNPQPVAVTVNAAGTVLYSVDSNVNTITRFSIDAATGALNTLSNVHTGFTPQQIVLNAAGTLAFVANEGEDTVAVFTVAADGTLTPVAGSPFFVPNLAGNVAMPRDVAGPSSITLHPTLPLLYVTNSFDNSVATMSIGTGGVLTAGPVIATVGHTPLAMVVDTAGAYAYVAERNATRVEQFTVDNAGALASLDATIVTGNNPAGIAFDPSGSYLYTANSTDAANGVSLLSIDQPTDAVTTVASAATGIDSTAVLVDSTGAVYVTNSGDPTSMTTPVAASISAFTADPATGLLTANGTSSSPVGARLYGLAFAKP